MNIWLFGAIALAALGVGGLVWGSAFARYSQRMWREWDLEEVADRTRIGRGLPIAFLVGAAVLLMVGLVA